MRASISTDKWVPDKLDQALMDLRRFPVSDGRLWVGLLAAMNVSEEDLATALRDGHGVAVISDEVWSRVLLIENPKLPLGLSTAGAVLSLSVDGQKLLLSEDPWSTEATLTLARAGSGAQLALARPGQWQTLLVGRPARQLQGLVEPDARKTGNEVGGDSSVVRFVDDAIARAYREGASDIHFETHRAGITIKYRLDGVMASGERLANPQQAEEVISRIKVMAQLDITERRRPQDGRIHWSRAGNEALDLRVSIMPSIFGEDAVLRLLDKARRGQSIQSMSLDALGFESVAAESIRSLASRPHGMLLVTGPTGSGKTTTVYAAMTEVNDGLEKIITIEDPVEYELAGVLQIPVNEQKGLTFATGLRSILRHDPDKILVGEIRDSETAEIAVQSALTGHLVFTTVHANSLLDVLGRFQHFGIDPFALASALNGVVVQRLLRRLCQHCSGWRDSTSSEQKKLSELNLSALANLPRPVGCEHCRQTGYRGRFVVAEVHELGDSIRDLIVRRASASELRIAINQDPTRRLLAQALDYVARGSTTIDEVARVVGLA
jgi:general secretion pathway protein E